MKTPLVNQKCMSNLWRAEDEALLREVVVVLLSEIEQRCSAIEHALAPLDRATVRHHAHGLNGAASNVCADRLASVAAEIEMTAAVASLDTLMAASARLRSVAHETSAALRIIANVPPC
jgi:HPt (histidine-containing phosphotransfer) domain-containing protein